MFVQFAHKSCLPQIDILDHNSLIGYAGLLLSKTIGKTFKDIRLGSQVTVSNLGYMRDVQFRDLRGEVVEIERRPGFMYGFRLDEVLADEDKIILKGFGGKILLKEAMIRPDYYIKADIHPQIFRNICYHSYGTFPYIKKDDFWKPSF